MFIRYILFDLDGTLLPMDQNRFVRTYFGALSNYMIPHGFEPTVFADTVWRGTSAMFQNDGSQSNEDIFWQTFTSVYGQEARKFEPILNTFYYTHFPKVQSVCGYDPKAAEIVKKLKAMGFELALATQPIFPAVATETRMKWAGLDQRDFLLYTTYENSSFCKPNPEYYRQVLAKIGADPSECLMVGNDATEDLIAQTLGIKVFLMTNCLINKEGKDLSQCPQGNWEALMHYIHSM